MWICSGLLQDQQRHSFLATCAAVDLKHDQCWIARCQYAFGRNGRGSKNVSIFLIYSQSWPVHVVSSFLHAKFPTHSLLIAPRLPFLPPRHSYFCNPIAIGYRIDGMHRLTSVLRCSTRNRRSPLAAYGSGTGAWTWRRCGNLARAAATSPWHVPTLWTTRGSPSAAVRPT